MNSDVHSESVHGACLMADVLQVGPPLPPGTQTKRPCIEGWFGEFSASVSPENVSVQKRTWRAGQLPSLDAG
jgi:hypothetical protein